RRGLRPDRRHHVGAAEGRYPAGRRDELTALSTMTAEELQEYARSKATPLPEGNTAAAVARIDWRCTLYVSCPDLPAMVWLPADPDSDEWGWRRLTGGVMH